MTSNDYAPADGRIRRCALAVRRASLTASARSRECRPAMSAGNARNNFTVHRHKLRVQFHKLARQTRAAGRLNIRYRNSVPRR